MSPPEARGTLQDMTVPQLALAQVMTAHPNEFTLSVQLPHLGMLSGVRVRVAADHATSVTGDFRLPEQGAWGIVVFYQDDVRSGLWTHTIPDARQHAAPHELLSEDPRARVTYHASGAQVIHTSDGDQEYVHGDGTLVRLTSSDRDPREQTPRKRSVRQGTGTARVPFTPPKLRPAHLFVRRVTDAGAVILDVHRDGTLDLHLDAPGGQAYALHGTPEGEMQLRNRAGARMTLTEDGSVRAAVQGGSAVTVDAAGSVSLSTPGGAHVTITPAGSIDIQAAPGMPVTLQGAGAPVAHVGSLVGPGPGGLQVLSGNPLLQTAPGL